MRQIAVLHCMSGPEFGGTAFYRHRMTGFESADTSRHDAYMQALGADLKRMDAHGFEQRHIDGDTSLFERIASIESVYNRIVIYRCAIPERSVRLQVRQRSQEGEADVERLLHFRPGGMR